MLLKINDPLPLLYTVHLSEMILQTYFLEGAYELLFLYSIKRIAIVVFDKTFILLMHIYPIPAPEITSCLPGRHPPVSSVHPVSVTPHPHPYCLQVRCQVTPSTQRIRVMISEKVSHPTPETLTPVNNIDFFSV